MLTKSRSELSVTLLNMDGLMIGFEERTRKQGKVVSMVVPQVHILRHPACGAFLSHCGWNAVLESVTSAVPLIAWPQQYEQWMTARSPFSSLMHSLKSPSFFFF